jgi:hypothetical protein
MELLTHRKYGDMVFSLRYFRTGHMVVQSLWSEFDNAISFVCSKQ